MATRRRTSRETAQRRAEAAALRALARLDPEALAAVGAALATGRKPRRRLRKPKTPRPERRRVVYRFDGPDRGRPRRIATAVLERRIVDFIKAAGPDGVDLAAVMVAFPVLGDRTAASKALQVASRRWDVGIGADGRYREGPSFRARRPRRTLERDPDDISGQARYVLGLLREGRNPPLRIRKAIYAELERAGHLRKVPTRDMPDAFPKVFDWVLVRSPVCVSEPEFC